MGPEVDEVDRVTHAIRFRPGSGETWQSGRVSREGAKGAKVGKRLSGWASAGATQDIGASEHRTDQERVQVEIGNGTSPKQVSFAASKLSSGLDLLVNRRPIRRRLMATYHLYYLRGGQLVGSEDIEAATDNDAARIAEDQGRGDIVEVWSSESRVRIVRTGGARLETPWDQPGAAEAAIA
jgi:hypothetical protein